MKPELLAALFPATVGGVKPPQNEEGGKQSKREEALSVKEYLHELAIYGLTYSVEWGRVKLMGDDEKILRRCRSILAKRPELEARLILHEAVRDADLLDELQERASIRWVEGYSDSLYAAVMCNIKGCEESREFNDKPDEKQAEFLRYMGIPETEIQDKKRCPSVWIKYKDWEAELREYRQGTVKAGEEVCGCAEAPMQG